MIPHNIKREHVLYAFEKIYLDGLPAHRGSTKYALVHKGERYPPKYIISIANIFANDRELDPTTFSGGEETNQYLEKLGFNIIELDNQKIIRRDPILPNRDQSIQRQNQARLNRRKKKNHYIDQGIEGENISLSSSASTLKSTLCSKLITKIQDVFARYNVKSEHILHDSKNSTIIVVRLSDKSIWDNMIWPELSKIRSVTGQRSLQDVEDTSTFSVLISYNPVFVESINLDGDHSLQEVAVTNEQDAYDVWLQTVENKNDYAGSRWGQVTDEHSLEQIGEFEELDETAIENSKGENLGRTSKDQGIESDHETSDLDIPLIATIIPPQYEEWIVSLPFPLASILSSCFAEAEVRARVIRLFNFFRVLAQFSATVLLSEYASAANRYKKLSELISHSSPRFGQIFINPTFGSWIILAEWLGMKRREKPMNESDRKFAPKTSRPINSIFRILGSKDLSFLLREVLILKTSWKNSGLNNSHNEIDRFVKNLMDSLTTCKGILGNVSTRLELVKTESNKSDQQAQQYVTKLAGMAGPFNKNVSPIKDMLAEASLYIFLKNEYGPPESLPLLPFFLIMEEDSQNAVCYVYDGIDDFGVRWLSYHCKQLGQIYTSDSGQNDVIALLQTPSA